MDVLNNKEGLTIDMLQGILKSIVDFAGHGLDCTDTSDAKTYFKCIFEMAALGISKL